MRLVTVCGVFVAYFMLTSGTRCVYAKTHYDAYSVEVLMAEQHATAGAKIVLQQTRHMALSKELIKGACWDYLNEAWNRAGVVQSKRLHIFNGSYDRGPYADVTLIRTGDWLYHINHSYHEMPHSGLFIAWIDRAKHQALMFSYAGEHRKEPARYRVYTIDKVYHIMRAPDTPLADETMR